MEHPAETPAVKHADLRLLIDMARDLRFRSALGKLAVNTTLAMHVASPAQASAFTEQSNAPVLKTGVR
jgi:hypothetical protein